MKKERHFTATVFIFHENRVLLIFHKKLQKWVPPGGHLDPNELPTEAAIREAKEETGLDIELILQENLWVDKQWNGCSFARPYMCLLEEIPEYNGILAHQHMDFIYIGKPIGGKIQFNAIETDGIRWFTIEEVQKLTVHIEIFEECQKLISQFFESENRILLHDLTSSQT